MVTLGRSRPPSSRTRTSDGFSGAASMGEPWRTAKQPSRNRWLGHSSWCLRNSHCLKNDAITPYSTHLSLGQRSTCRSSHLTTADPQGLHRSASPGPHLHCEGWTEYLRRGCAMRWCHCRAGYPTGGPSSPPIPATLTAKFSTPKTMLKLQFYLHSSQVRRILGVSRPTCDPAWTFAQQPFLPAVSPPRCVSRWLLQSGAPAVR